MGRGLMCGAMVVVLGIFILESGINRCLAQEEIAPEGPCVPTPSSVDKETEKQAKEALKVFEQAFKSEKEPERIKAIEQLGRVDHSLVVKRLEAVIKGKDTEPVKNAALKVLANRFSWRGASVESIIQRVLTPRLQAAARSLAKEDYVKAIQDLKEMNAPVIVHILEPIIMGKTPAEVKQAALRIIAQMNPLPEDTFQLFKKILLINPDDDILMATLEGYIEMGRGKHFSITSGKMVELIITPLAEAVKKRLQQLQPAEQLKIIHKGLEALSYFGHSLSIESLINLWGIKPTGLDEKMSAEIETKIKGLLKELTDQTLGSYKEAKTWLEQHKAYLIRKTDLAEIQNALDDLSMGCAEAMKKLKELTKKSFANQKQWGKWWEDFKTKAIIIKEK